MANINQTAAEVEGTSLVYHAGASQSVLTDPNAHRYLGWDDTANAYSNYVYDLAHWINVLDHGAVGDGVTDDSAAIQAAIDAAETAGGGVVFAPPGTYLLATPAGATSGWLEIDSTHIWLKGAGMGKTVFKMADSITTATMGTDGNFILVAGYNASGASVQHVFLSDFTIDGNRANQSYTTVATAAINAFNIHDGGIFRVHVTGWHSDPAPGQEPTCIHLVDSLRSYIRDCHATDSPQTQGQRLSSSVTIGDSNHCSILNCYADTCLSGQIMWQMAKSSIVGCSSKTSTNDGIDCEDGRGCLVSGCNVEASGQSGIRVSESHDCIVVGNVSRNNNQDAAGAGNSSGGITLNGTGAGGGTLTSLITGNHCFDDQGSPTQNYGVQEYEDADNNLISGNFMRLNAISNILITGAGTRSENNFEGDGSLITRRYGATEMEVVSADVTLADDAATRFAAADIPDHGFCQFVAGDGNQMAFFFYDLGHATLATVDMGKTIGGTMSLDGNVARTGTDGTDAKINIGASSVGLDVENRAGGQITFRLKITVGGP